MLGQHHLEHLRAQGREYISINDAEQLLSEPVDMLLFCPQCFKQHIDAPAGEWTNPPHRSHLCGFCGTEWRPSDHATNGVASIRTSGKNDGSATPEHRPAVVIDLDRGDMPILESTRPIGAERLEQFATEFRAALQDTGKQVMVLDGLHVAAVVRRLTK